MWSVEWFIYLYQVYVCVRMHVLNHLYANTFSLCLISLYIWGGGGGGCHCPFCPELKKNKNGHGQNGQKIGQNGQKIGLNSEIFDID